MARGWFLGQIEPLTKPNVLARSREIRGIKDANDEAGVLGEWLVLIRQVSELKTAIKDNEEFLEWGSSLSTVTTTGCVLRAE